MPKTSTKRVVKNPKPKTNKVSSFEKNLLRYPPTEGTWYCENHKNDAGNPDPIPNAGGANHCCWCGEPKPENPRLVWPLYVIACEKVFIEPGYSWKIHEKTQEPMKKKRGEKWETAPIPEGFRLEVR